MRHKVFMQSFYVAEKDSQPSEEFKDGLKISEIEFKSYTNKEETSMIFLHR